MNAENDDSSDDRDCEMPPGMAPRLDNALEAFEETLYKNDTPILAGLILFWAPCKVHGGGIEDEQWLREDLLPGDVAKIRQRLAEYLAELNKKYPPA